jgi:hypothetical protein
MGGTAPLLDDDLGARLLEEPMQEVMLSFDALLSSSSVPACSVVFLSL